MKIGTITFHWGNNYGAVLQAFALQKWLKKQNIDTAIIDYIPFKIALRIRIMELLHLHFSFFIKEKAINKFRKKHLCLSKIKYENNNQLKKMHEKYDAIICGSDQIWNTSFTMNAEGKPTLSYFLNFVDDSVLKLAYATSFGCEQLPDKMIEIIYPYLQKFKLIGVRENTGKEIINKMGLLSTIVIDPTVLLSAQDYEALINKSKNNKRFELFSYILHSKQKTAHLITDYVYKKYFNSNIEKVYKQEPIGIEDWLYNIKNARYIITNSFHGIIFSIIFHKNFIAIPVENCKMNDRIITLLSSLNLEKRIISGFDEYKIDELYESKINWDAVDYKLDQLREGSCAFLKEFITMTEYKMNK